MAYTKVKQPSLSPLLRKFLSQRGLLSAYKSIWRTDGLDVSFIDSLTSALSYSVRKNWAVQEEHYRHWKGKHILHQLRNVKMKVVRIEHPSCGVGMFRYSDLSEERLEEYSCDLEPINSRHSDMPTPSEDSIDNDAIRKLGNWRCAYFDVSELNRWVRSSEIEVLVKKWGFRVYEISVKAPLVGNYQVVYGVKNIIKKVDITNTLINIEDGQQ